MENIKSYVQENKDVSLKELIELLKNGLIWGKDTAYSQDVNDTSEAVIRLYWM
jgi:hypothetical protein